MRKQSILWPEIEEPNGSVLAKDDLQLQAITDLSEIEDGNKVFERIKSVDWSFTEDNTTYLSHNLHPYPAKYIPQIPCNFISALSLPGETVWDPFGGSGTTAFEALLQGRAAISTDANPIASLVASSKCCTLTPEQITTLNKFAERFDLLAHNPDDADAILFESTDIIKKSTPKIPNFEKWFNQTSAQELGYIRNAINQLEDDDSREFAKASFSAIIIKVSFQDSETRYASKPRDINRGEVFTCFAKHLAKVIKKHKPVHSLLGYRKATIETLDLRNFEDDSYKDIFNKCLPKESVDLIVTSPPYANVTDYHLYHRFRLFWLGFSPTEFGACEIGSHLRHQRKKMGFDLYLKEMTTCLKAMHYCLRPGRFAVIVVGDSIFNKKTICTADELSKEASKIGFETIGIIERDLHKTKRSFNVAARRAKAERIMIIRKPIQEFKVSIQPPNYRQWEYEKILRHKEVEALLGRKVSNNKKTIVTNATPLEFDRLRRLTFSHHVDIPKSSSFNTWQAIIENGNSFENAKNRKDPKYVTHGIHPYKGKFYPQLAKTLINLSGQTNGTILDPYCGSGTVLLESQLNGFNAIGFDLNPMANLIAKAKTGIINADLYEIDLCIHDFLDDLNIDKSKKSDLKRFPKDCLDEIISWFPGPVACSIAWIISRIERVPIISLQQALKVSLSSIIREVSQQDPKDLRIRRRKEPIENAPTLDLFKKRVLDLRQRLREFAIRKVHCPNDIGRAKAIYGDSRLWDSFTNENVEPHTIDMMVTSPPYATALPYIDTDRLSILTIHGIPSRERAPLERSLTGSREIKKFDRNVLEEQIGSTTIDKIGSATALDITKKIYTLNANADVGFRRKNMGALLLRYFQDLHKTLTSVDTAVKNGGSMFVVIGNNYTKAGDEKIAIENTKYTVEMGRQLNWNLVEEIPITVTKEGFNHEKHFIATNSILWFSK
jgi:DNA modification methylase